MMDHIHGKPVSRPGIPVVRKPPAGSLDVRQIRRGARGIGATQQVFADAIGVPVKTVRNWEQRRREPTGPARILLSVIARNPWAVFDTLREENAPAA